MSDSQRHLQLDALKGILKTASVVSVELCTGKRSLASSGYEIDDLPMIEVFPGSESPQPYLTGKLALWKFNVELTCYFLGDNDWEKGEALLKEMKDAIGGNTTLNGYAVTVNHTGSRSGGEFPLYNIGLSIQIVYERKITEG